MEAHCEGGQGPPRAVMPRKKKANKGCKIVKTALARLYLLIVSYRTGYNVKLKAFWYIAPCTHAVPPKRRCGLLPIIRVLLLEAVSTLKRRSNCTIQHGAITLKANEVGRACGTHGRGEKSVQGSGGKAQRKETTGKTKA
jgi:hypothetical protein